MSTWSNGAVSPRRRRRWLWLFLVAALILAILLGLMVRNLNQPMPLEQLQAAQQQWRQQKPRHYLLTYQVKRRAEQADFFSVTVEHGRVTAVTVNGLPEPPERFQFYGMEVLFGYLQRFQDLDAKPGRPRTFTRAKFDPHDGHLLWYVRQILGENEGQEIVVESFQIKDEPRPADDQGADSTRTDEEPRTKSLALRPGRLTDPCAAKEGFIACKVGHTLCNAIKRATKHCNETGNAVKMAQDRLCDCQASWEFWPHDLTA